MATTTKDKLLREQREEMAKRGEVAECAIGLDVLYYPSRGAQPQPAKIIDKLDAGGQPLAQIPHGMSPCFEVILRVTGGTRDTIRNEVPHKSDPFAGYRGENRDEHGYWDYTDDFKNRGNLRETLYKLKDHYEDFRQHVLALLPGRAEQEAQERRLSTIEARLEALDGGQEVAAPRKETGKKSGKKSELEPAAA